MEQRVRPRTQKSRNSRRAYIKRRRKQALIIRASIFIVIIASIIGGAFLVKKLSGSKKIADLDKYYGIEKENQLAVILDDEIIGARGLLINGYPYIEYSVVHDHLNQGFYLDENENILLYTLPDGTVRTGQSEKEYEFQRETKSTDYVILKMEGDTAYVSLDFVQEYTNIDFTLYKDPNRVVIVSEWGNKNVATVKKHVQIRENANIKSSILTDAAKKETVTIVGEDGKWKKVCTEDGVIGYIKKNTLKNFRTETISREFEEPVYSNISKDYTINMAWHMVTSGTASSAVLEKIANTKGLTTISPTWFAVSNTSGNISSLANEKYVNYTGQLGIEVWALVKDFDGGIDSQDETYQLLSRTSSRKNLIEQLVLAVKKYNIDGINVDFENISEECGEHYLQFLRELSAECRKEKIVLSVDVPVPSQYSEQYDLKEIGKVVDYVIVMGYDEHYAGSPESGPVASYDFVKKGIEDALKEVPASKLINAVPFYTRLWTEVEKTVEEMEAEEAAGSDAAEYPYKVSSKAYGMSNIYVAIENAGAEIVVDEATGQNYAEWKVDSKTTCKVWLEDEDALEAKLKRIKDNDLAGVAGWRLGFESLSAWELILKYVK